MKPNQQGSPLLDQCQSSIKTNTIDIVTKPKSDSTMEIFEPFMLNGFVSLSGDNCPPTPIKIVRGTGASQSLILADILPFSEKTSSSTSVLIQCVECGTVNIPLHHVNLSSDLVTGLVVIGITPSLPFGGVHLLLGNDLAGDKVVVSSLVELLISLSITLICHQIWLLGLWLLVLHLPCHLGVSIYC